MKVLLRADAGLEQGTGHVMRCLTLAEGLASRGHSVELMGNVAGVEWLNALIRSSGFVLHPCPKDTLDIDTIGAIDPDWVVVDSYRIDSDLITRLNETVRCLAIVDGDTRGMGASLYVDQNIGSDERDWPSEVRKRLLAGHSYSLVRNDVLKHRGMRRSSTAGEKLKVAAFMGGTDPRGAIVDVAASIAASKLDFDLTVVCPVGLEEAVSRAVGERPRVAVLGPTRNLPEVLSGADVVVSAAGTSAWDICTIGIPAVFVAVVDNQLDSLQQTIARELAFGINAVGDRKDELTTVGRLVDTLVSDPDLRQKLTKQCLSTFDGKGKLRVVAAMEGIFAGPSIPVDKTK